MKRGHSHPERPYSPPATQADIATLAKYLKFTILDIYYQLSIRLSHLESLIMTMQEDVDAMAAELVTANETTNEIAADLADLISKLGSSPTPASVAALKTGISEIVSKLQGVAATHTPDAPTP